MTVPIVYLACPYTHPDPAVRLGRYKLATRAAAYIAMNGLIVYSPITMTHPMDLIMGGQTATLGSNYWIEFDTAFMEVCSRIIVLTLDGWKESNGVQREIAFFTKKKRKITYLSPEEVNKSRLGVLP
jgi:hypothetical protein